MSDKSFSKLSADVTGRTSDVMYQTEMLPEEKKRPTSLVFVKSDKVALKDLETVLNIN